jgi:phosphoglycolate phosphatase
MKGTLQKADLIKKAMALSEERDVESVVMVGDTIGDAKAAEACGIAFIGVSYGFGRLEKPLIKNMVKLADKPEDIYINL